jgi:MoaA/NifB/PqqE/SkfB family radical SAM enzyme
MLQGIREGAARGGPFHVEVHPSSRCGLGCFFCSTRAWRQAEDLPLQMIERLAAEMRTLGTRSVCLSGGGEPLAHRQAVEVIRAFGSRGVPVSHLTTNGQGLGPEVVQALLEARCQEVIVSLNCGEPGTYATMMQTSPAMFDRVTGNIAGLLARRRAVGSRWPAVILQLLIYKGNYETIPEMYECARTLGVDGVIFNGLSFLPPEMRMSAAETERMAELLEEVMVADEMRRVLGIGSFEQDVSGMVARIEARIGAERSRQGRVRRALRTLARPDFSMRQKWDHHVKMRRLRTARRLLATGFDPCIRAWYSLTVKTDGTVPVCCARQHVILADLGTSTLEEVWYGPRLEALRRGMRRAIVQGASWSSAGTEDDGVALRCSAVSTGIERCPFRSFYFRHDQRFFRSLAEVPGRVEHAPGS